MLRKVKISEHQDGSGAFNINGYFHQWGTMNYPTDDGRDFPFTCAIIELENGNVQKIDPKKIRFVVVNF